ncbi:ribonuclease E/G [Mannheimia haemolytica]|nr:ribonuclease E/G [Mannheimia haemolytica]
MGGFIVRTAAEDVSEESLQQDANFLKRLWRKVLERKSNILQNQCSMESLP